MVRTAGARRLLAAAAVCVVSLGLSWSPVAAGEGYLTPGMTLPSTSVDMYGDLYTTYTYYPGYWVPGFDLTGTRGFRSDVRAVLVPAGAALAWAATRRTRATRRAARAAVVALAALLAVACSRGMPTAVLSMAGALWLAAPIAWPGLVTWTRRTRRPGREGSPGGGAPSSSRVGPTPF